MYKKGAGNDKQGKDAGNRTLCPYRNFSQAITFHINSGYTELCDDNSLFHILMTKTTLYNVCAVPWGCSVPWGVFSTVGDILSTVGGYLEYRGGVQYRGGYHEYRGGYLEYRGGCSVPWGIS